VAQHSHSGIKHDHSQRNNSPGDEPCCFASPDNPALPVAAAQLAHPSSSKPSFSFVTVAVLPEVHIALSVRHRRKPRDGVHWALPQFLPSSLLSRAPPETT
jgi:hypothetical protein